ncbi:reverse transcriptase domain-containing protein [Tanacetum coccineum]
MGQLAKALQERPQGALPSNTVPNPREDVKVITTWSGVTLAGPLVPPHPLLSSSKEVKRDPKLTMDQPPIPYPSRLNKEKLQDKSDIQIHKFLQMFKKLHFNISLAEALALMPKYAKIELKKCFALADLGASINLMPLSVWKKLLLPELVPTYMTLELANRSVAYPAGIAEDVFVQVGKFTFPADFVIVDYDVDPRVPLYLKETILEDVPLLISLPDYEAFCFDVNHQKEKSSGSATSHFDHSLPDYEAFFFDIDHQQENNSGSTNSHFDPSLLEYESFYFDDDLKEFKDFIYYDPSINPPPIAKRSDSHHEEFADEVAHIISPPEYDYFYFDIEADPGEFTRLFNKNLSSESVNLNKIINQNFKH